MDVLMHTRTCSTSRGWGATCRKPISNSALNRLNSSNAGSKLTTQQGTPRIACTPRAWQRFMHGHGITLAASLTYAAKESKSGHAPGAC